MAEPVTTTGAAAAPSDRPAERYRRLPQPVPLDQTVPAVPATPTPDPTAGWLTDLDKALVRLGG